MVAPPAGGHLHEVVPAGCGLRAGTLYRTGWAMLANCPSADLELGSFDRHVDLRNPVECADTPLAARRGTVLRVPIDAGTAEGRLAGRPSSDDYRALCLDTLENCGPAIAESVDAIAQLLPGPVVIGCSLGKDRTGLVTGLLLSALGVPAEAVLRQDATARARITGCEVAVRQYAAGRGFGVRELRRRCRLGRSALDAALRMIGTEFGGAAGYLRAHGTETSVLSGLRAALTG